MDCPECSGRGGGTDYWGEWDDCPCCKGAGKCSPDRHASYRAYLVAEDARIDAIMSAPCEKCGVETADCECGNSWDAATH